MKQEFPPHMFIQLGFYVYSLIDPRNHQPFYIGKGKGNRVFAHVKDELKKFEQDEDELTTKLKTIRQIRNAGLEPESVIYRHNLTENEAFLVESVLIDLFKQQGLSNIVMGHGSDEFGIIDAYDLLKRYKKEIMTIEENIKVMAVKISKTVDYYSIYESVRCAWRCSRSRAERADYVFAIHQGLCVGVFIPDIWLPAYKKDFPRLSEDMPNRWGFIGCDAPSDITEKYKDKLLCPKSFKQNIKSQTSILYNYQ